MPNFEQINVEPYPAISEFVDPTLLTGTAFFRASTYLPIVLDRVLADVVPDELSSFSMLSVGCSYGAEVDSALAGFAILDPNLLVTATGVDVNPYVIERAEGGQYVARLKDEKKIAALCGLIPTISVEGPAAWSNGTEGCILDTTKLRDRHDVAFTSSGIEGCEVAEADLILCNNMLFYVDSDSSKDALVAAMAERLKLGGILSFEANPARMKKQYIDWRQKIAEGLRDQGIIPILSATNLELPYAFQKVA